MMMESQPMMALEQGLAPLGKEQPHLRNGNTKIYYYDPRSAVTPREGTSIDYGVPPPRRHLM